MRHAATTAGLALTALLPHVGGDTRATVTGIIVGVYVAGEALIKSLQD
jgi:hypothetical protein